MLTQDVAAAPADQPVALEKLEVSEGSGLVLTDSFTLPDDEGTTTVGAARYEAGDQRWVGRTPVEDTVLQPGESTNITAVLRRVGSDPGRASALTLTYRVGDELYRRSNTTTYSLEDSCA